MIQSLNRSNHVSCHSSFAVFLCSCYSSQHCFGVRYKSGEAKLSIMQTCKRCGSTERHKYRCVPCNRDYKKVWARKKRYHLTHTVKNKLLNIQNNSCAVCFTRTPGGKGWHIDHNHQTGNIRGILCVNCNFALGLFKDNVTHLRAAINYLMRGI